MLLCRMVPVGQVPRRILLMALLLPAACTETPAPSASPFYLAPSRDTAASSSPAGREMEEFHGMKQPGDASSMQDMARRHGVRFW